MIQLEKLETLSHESQPRAAVFSPDESLLFIGGWWEQCDVFLVQNLEKIGELTSKETDETVYSLDCRSNNEIAVAYANSHVVIWSYSVAKNSLKTDVKKVIAPPEGTSGCRCVKYSSAAKRNESEQANPRLVASYESDSSSPLVRIYNSNTGEILFDWKSTLEKHPVKVMGLAWRNQDSEILLCGRDDGFQGEGKFLAGIPFFAIDPNYKKKMKPEGEKQKEREDEKEGEEEGSGKGKDEDDEDCILYDLCNTCEKNQQAEEEVLDSWGLDYDDNTGIAAVPNYSAGGVFIVDVSKKKLIAKCKISEASGSSTTNACILFNRGRAVCAVCEGAEIFEIPSLSSSSSSSLEPPTLDAKFRVDSTCESIWTVAVAEKNQLLVLPDYSNDTKIYRLEGFLFDRRKIVLKLRFLPNVDSHCFEIYSICFLVSSYL